MSEQIKSLDELMAVIQSARLKALKEPEDSFDIAKDAREMAITQDWPMAEAGAVFVMALSCRSMSKLERCYEYAMEALTLYESLADNLGISTALNLIGVVYFYYGKMETALEYFMRALHYLKGTTEPITESRILNNIGEVYKESGHLEEALESYQKALWLCETLDMKANIAVVLENIGEIHFRRGSLETSYEYFSKSYEMLLTLEDTAALSEVENKLGKLLFLQGQREAGKERCLNALERLEAMGNTFFAIEVLMTLAEIKLDEGSDAYLEDLSRAVYYAESLNARKLLRKLYKLFYEYYENQSIYDFALFYFKKFHHVELEIESTMVSHKLEIIKIELNRSHEGDAVERVKNLNNQLEMELKAQAHLLKQLEQANKKLDEAVYVDELTQVLNRRGINKKLEAFWLSEEQATSEIALLMIDIDHFKNFNDVYGHIQGDKCLQQIAGTMTAVLSDKAIFLGRYGGEEFACVLVNANEQETQEQAELLRVAVASAPIAIDYPRRHVPVTISVGVTQGFKYHYSGLQDLFIRADEALYDAKNSGRNKVCFSKSMNRFKKS